MVYNILFTRFTANNLNPIVDEDFISLGRSFPILLRKDVVNKLHGIFWNEWQLKINYIFNSTLDIYTS